MTLEDQIAELLLKAAPLRLLPDDESEAAGLPGIVDSINALRAKQAKAAHVEALAEVAEQKREDIFIGAAFAAGFAEAVREEVDQSESLPDEPVRRRPGRPKKAE